ncbi:MAG: efflux RND transporter periplasmic adaptor subunit [Holophagales bacterium]|nr:efflux RND transporter periplasmic adaptor subunit [Holophagales bacterium]
MSPRPRHVLLAALPFVLVLAACGRKGPEAAPKAGAAPAALPDDVKPLESALAPAPPAGGSAAGATAPADERVLLATGEFIPLVSSELVARVTGRVAKVLVDEGARVSEGQPMLTLETDYLRIDVARAEAETARASALLADAERDFARKKELVAKESVSKAAFERSEAAFEGAKAARLGAEAGLDLAKQRLSDAVLRSPIDGVVLERRADVGERLSEGTVTFVVVQTAPLRLRFRVPERFLGAAERGAKVHATVDPYPGETFDGTVSVVVPALDPASRTFAVEALFPNRDGRLRTGLFARVELERPAAKR